MLQFMVFSFNEKLEFYHYLGTTLVFFGVYLAKKNENKT
jgi:drug/metabolite transporter (DMT)-like permease